jgi:hypothetical protein
MFLRKGVKLPPLKSSGDYLEALQPVQGQWTASQARAVEAIPAVTRKEAEEYWTTGPAPIGSPEVPGKRLIPKRRHSHGSGNSSEDTVFRRSISTDSSGYVTECQRDNNVGRLSDSNPGPGTSPAALRGLPPHAIPAPGEHAFAVGNNSQPFYAHNAGHFGQPGQVGHNFRTLEPQLPFSPGAFSMGIPPPWQPYTQQSYGPPPAPYWQGHQGQMQAPAQQYCPQHLMTPPPALQFGYPPQHAPQPVYQNYAEPIDAPRHDVYEAQATHAAPATRTLTASKPAGRLVIEDEATAAKRRKYACPWQGWLASASSGRVSSLTDFSFSFVSGCGKSFTTSGNLCRHRALHLSIKPFRCPIEGCTMKFSRADSLRDHHTSHLRRLNAAVQGASRAVKAVRVADFPVA